MSRLGEYRRKRPICENALIENALIENALIENALIKKARFFLLFTTVYFFFFSSSFLFFSFLVLFFLVIYVHSPVSSSVVSGVHFFLTVSRKPERYIPYYSQRKHTQELDLTAEDSLHSGVGTSYVTFKHWNKV